MNDLGNSLIEALGDSAEVRENLRRIQEAGYSLYLAVECKEGIEDEAGTSRPVQKSSPRGPVEPVFRINTDDLSFLRSIGIDPTRSKRRTKRG